MTFVGKILVILIMAFSLVFLGVSTVVFSTATNWKDKSTKQTEEIGKLKKSLSDAQTKVTAAEGQLKTAKEEHANQIKDKERLVATLETKTKDSDGEMTQARSQLEVAQNNAKVSLAEATARKGEIDVLNETLTKAQTQANQFSAQNIELTDQIRVLQREKTTAEQNATDLRGVVGRFMAYIRQNGIPYEKIEKLDATKVPPAVEGKVTELNSTKRSMEISIGSDDGLAVGQELYVFRVQPRAEYIGKVKIVSVYPDQAVAEIIGNTVNGKKVQEGDIVSSTFFNSK
jgi:predicted  nucleic acid-binding Zn-ribbon protein